MTAAHVLPVAAVAVLLPWSIYRRVKRNVGPQPLSSPLLKTRFGFLLLVLVLVAWPWLQHTNLAMLGALAAGGAAGIVVAWYALRHTRFEQKDGKDFYVPNAKIGLTLSFLLIARVLYRLYQVYPLLDQPGGPSPDAMAAMSTPTTTALIGLVLIYYMAYCLGVLTHPSRPDPAGKTSP